MHYMGQFIYILQLIITLTLTPYGHIPVQALTPILQYKRSHAMGIIQPLTP